MIRVLLADDQPIVRAGLRTILDLADDIDIVGEAADGAQALALAGTLAPDVVVMDIRMPVLDGIQATRQINRSAHPARVLILTTYALDDYVYQALRAGAAGFLLKTDPPERLVDAVRVVAAGDALLGPTATRRLIEQYVAGPPPTSSPPAGLGQLTDREREVLDHVARGLSNSEIAQVLYVVDGTVKTHVARILAKLELRNRAQLIIYAYEHGLITPGTRQPPR
jgi:DNA-binding NarL/FixJ family response regulator